MCIRRRPARRSTRPPRVPVPRRGQETRRRSCCRRTRRSMPRARRVGRAVRADLPATAAIGPGASRRRPVTHGWATAARRYPLDPARLAQDARTRARELGRAAPTHPYCLRVGISSSEGLWCRFEGDDATHPCSELVGPDLPPTKLERGSVPPEMAGRCSSQALPGSWSPARCRRMLRSGISVRIDSRASIVPSTSSGWSSPICRLTFRPSTRNRHPCPMRRAGCRPCRTALSAVRTACARSRTGLASAARGCSPSSVLAGSARRAWDWRWCSRCSAVFAAGARFVSLASVRRAQDVPAAVVQALRIVQLSRQREIGCPPRCCICGEVVARLAVPLEADPYGCESPR
jgi:hypothetical protein